MRTYTQFIGRIFDGLKNDKKICDCQEVGVEGDIELSAYEDNNKLYYIRWCMHCGKVLENRVVGEHVDL